MISCKIFIFFICFGMILQSQYTAAANSEQFLFKNTSLPTEEWVNFYQNQNQFLEHSRQNEPIYLPTSTDLLTHQESIAIDTNTEIPLYILPENYELNVTAVSFNANDLKSILNLQPSEDIDPGSFFWRKRNLVASSLVKSTLETYNASANSLNLEMSFIIQPDLQSIVATSVKDLCSPCRSNTGDCLAFAQKHSNNFKTPQEILNHTPCYNEVTLMGPPLFQVLFPKESRPFKILGIFLKVSSLRQYMRNKKYLGYEYSSFLQTILQLRKKLPIYIDNGR